jgi:chromosome segregation ATPase
MTQQDQKELPQSARISMTPLVFASLVVVAATYFGFVRPAQQHMMSLERQCNKLVTAVKKLQSKDETARQGLRLIKLLDAQGEKLAGAEQALAQFSAFRERTMLEAEQMAEATQALQLLEDVRSNVNRHSQTLVSAATTLSEMAEVSASITASSEIARQVNGSLSRLGQQQSDLGGNITRLGGQLSGLETQLADRSHNLQNAEQTLALIDQLCEHLAGETKDLSTAERQLSQLAGFKQAVLEQTRDLPAAKAALDQIWDLKQGILQASSTIGKAQQLAVDMMLLGPKARDSVDARLPKLRRPVTQQRPPLPKRLPRGRVRSTCLSRC